MTCQYCHQATCSTTAALHDGRVVCTWSEDWRAECEARHIMNLPTLAERRAYLFGTRNEWGKMAGGIQQKRGDQALRKVQELVTILWNKSNTNKAA